MNSFMSWIGGKKALRDEILARFPLDYKRYIEVFGGGGWVLFHKPAGRDFEVYNDFNPNLANLYRCVRDHPKELIAELTYVLNSRTDFDFVRKTLHTKTEIPDIKRAAYFYQLIRQSYVTTTTKYISEEARRSKNLLIFQPGTILYAMYASVGKVAELAISATINQALLAIELGTTINGAFFKYALNAWEPYIISESNGTTQFNLNANKVANLCFPFPEIGEQANIVHYLDYKCGQVDTLITNVQTQIEKLKAYKQSVITEAVTKGLDPTVPMKDSGVEWIGEIPEHWDVKRGKALFKETDARSNDGSEELLTVSQYTGITPRSQKNVNMFEALSLEGYKICEIGDIAANTMWLWAGAIGVSEYRGVISPSYNVYRQRDNNFVPQYLDHLLRAPMLVQEYASLSTGIRASRLRLYPKDFFNIMFPVPPFDEQQAILDELSSKFSAVDRLIAIKQQKIEKLEQYKKSLIYEYVTGKREVM